VAGSGTTSTGTDNEIEGNFLQYCGNHGINAVDTYRTQIKNNYIVQSWAAGIEANGSHGSANGDISGNWVQDTQLQYNVPQGLLSAGNGNINLISAGGTGFLHGWLIHDNFVLNTNPVCNSNLGPSGSDHGCSEGIQATENPWDLHIYNNYIYNTGSEGITLCEYDCSATGNFVANAGENCNGCGGIIQAVQTGSNNLTIGNSVVSGNTIWADYSTFTTTTK
jgi:hypothetical protein